MTLRLRTLTPDAIEDAAAWWLYDEDEGWERWRLVPGSAVVSPNGQVLRLAFECEGDRFELALVQRGDALFARFDDREDPDEETPARVFEGDAELIVTFTTRTETVFVLIELAD